MSHEDINELDEEFVMDQFSQKCGETIEVIASKHNVSVSFAASAIKRPFALTNVCRAVCLWATSASVLETSEVWKEYVDLTLKIKQCPKTAEEAFAMRSRMGIRLWFD